MNKIIKARLPKGFRIEIQESKNFLPHNVLVLINDKKQRLYVKILEKEDLLNGYIFEILRPSELKQTLNIEESYNEEVFKDRGYYVEETLPRTPEEIEDALNRGLKKLKVEGKFKSLGEGQPVNIIIPKEDENSERPLTVEEKRYIAKEAFKTAIREAREEEALEKAEKEGLGVRTDPVLHNQKTGQGGGQIPLSPEQTGKRRFGEYSSNEEMIDDLRNRASVGDEDAKIILNELLRKTFAGRKEEPHRMEYEYRGEINPVTQKERGLVEKINEQYRKRVQLRGGMPNEN